jgi:hypothetical protein
LIENMQHTKPSTITSPFSVFHFLTPDTQSRPHNSCSYFGRETTVNKEHNLTKGRSRYQGDRPLRHRHELFFF